MSLSKYNGKANPSPERKFELLRAPIITEKSTLLSEFNQVSFRVPMDASKPEIKAAVEDLFKVNVTAVNTLIAKGKTKKFRGRAGKRIDTKKAIITLAEGQSIDVSTGV
ncbi:MAG: 50S ribosomal protein L23 [Rhodospirillaceae bacterium]|jgi:large subunit ribosomal protein L23|nr:50S ribosomal protein L23 [Rhodospirillaceae bacterium]MBT5563579.1 50S ribosomal protein L23 [Rhodospirillaceae bacterium]MBT6241411.1 50S ribosomal protein L23 [Rhodospirillaceae bacterium]MBT7136237.1 50S ribosomal protein L23 [Rhodospirillaceae bacterium]